MASEANDSKAFNILVSGSNSMIYCWQLLASRSRLRQQDDDIVKRDGTVLVPSEALLAAVVELPVKVA